MRENVKKRNMDHLVNVDHVVQLYDKHCKLVEEINRLRFERNNITDLLKKKKQAASASTEAGAQFDPLEYSKKAKDIKEKLAATEVESAQLWDELMLEALKLPNDLHPLVPHGPNGEEDAKIIKFVGTKKVSDVNTIVSFFFFFARLLLAS